MFHKVVVVERQCGQHLQRRRCHAPFVGRGVLEVHHARLDQQVTRSLAEEQVGAFHDVFLLGISTVQDIVHVGDVDSVGTASAGQENVGFGFVTEQPLVSEYLSVAHSLPIRQFEIPTRDRHELALLAESAFLVLHHLPFLGQRMQMFLAEALWVLEHSTPVDDGYDFLFAHE